MRHIILHSHIFKNAGTTFDHVLEKNFLNSFIDHRDDKQLINGKELYLVDFLQKNPQVKAFSSHSIHFHPQNSDTFTFHQIYFIRHPIERVMSVYNFEKKQGPSVSLGGKMANILNFNDYVAWRMQNDVPATIRNAHTIFISGMGPIHHNLNNMFNKAKHYINNSTLIGVVDRYDESMNIFRHTLKKVFPSIEYSYEKKNVTNNSAIDIDIKTNDILDSLDTHTSKLLLEKNAYDMELYKLANQRLDNILQKIRNC